MAFEAQKRVQEAVNKLLSDLDVSNLRKIQADMFHCSAKCCENRNASMEEVAQCVEQCSTKLSRAQEYISKELDGLRGQLERCAHSCEDGIRVKMTADTTDSEMVKLQSRFDDCVARCGNDTINMLPEIFKKMHSVIEKEAYHKAGF